MTKNLNKDTTVCIRITSYNVCYTKLLRMKEKCTIVDMTWDGLIPGLKANKIDVIWSSMSINDERKKVIAFTDKYYNTPTEIVGLKEEPHTVTKDDLKDKIIGTYVSSIQSAYFKKHYSDVATEKNYPTLRITSYNVCYTKLLRPRGYDCCRACRRSAQ